MAASRTTPIERGGGRGGRRRRGTAIAREARLATARPARIGAEIASITRAAHERWRVRRSRLADTADAGFHAVTTDPETTPARTTAKRLAAGAMSTMAVRTLLAPFERMKLEYMLNRSTTPLVPAVRDIFAREGLRGSGKETSSTS